MVEARILKLLLTEVLPGSMLHSLFSEASRAEGGYQGAIVSPELQHVSAWFQAVAGG